MPLAELANNWLVGLAKQSAEGTIPTTSDYALPVFSGRPQPVQTIDRVQVTDAASMIGDPFKAGDEHWVADLVVPAFAAPLGRILSMLWPTDTISGTGPYTHPFSGLGSATAWFAAYSDVLAGALDETFEAGKCTGLSFSADGSGGPLRVGVRMIGKRPTVAAWTIGGQAVLGDGYFTAKGATLKYEVDAGTPVAETNIGSFAVDIAREGAPIPTADSVSVSLIRQGLVVPSFTMQLIYEDWEAYRATFYGAVGGSTPSTTIVAGSVELNFVHSVQAGWSFKLEIPKAVLAAEPPQPDAGGSELIVPINGYCMKPATGDHVKPTLINAVATAY